MKGVLISSAICLCMARAFALETVAPSVQTIPPSSSSGLQDRPGDMAPLHVPSGAEAISGSYIVILKSTANVTQHHEWVTAQVGPASGGAPSRDMYLNQAAAAEIANGIHHKYNSHTWKGYSGRFTDDMVDKIRRSPDVDYVEKDSVVYTSELQRDAPWGLARISHRNTLALGTFNRYPYQAAAGRGVPVYVIDTGINIHHVDLEGRATWGVTILAGENDEDENGHGSHCAGTIAGHHFGVAKKSHPVAVKVLRSNGSGSMSGVIAGLSWATEQHQEQLAADRRYKGAVANLSLAGARSEALNFAVNEAVISGMVVAAAAGNDNRDACQYSPASAELAITAGAVNIHDERLPSSNYGPCVDIFAPGENIMSIWKGTNEATNTMSGTSTAAAHVSGLAAYIISLERHGGLVSPRRVWAKMLELATADRLTNLPTSTPNLLVYNGGNSK
ncbi:serine protease 1 [Dichotomocladium elegans]|nr:serine protease 1 [Dichotomocladium elegans]